MAAYHEAYDELEARLVGAGLDVQSLDAELDELTAHLRDMNAWVRPAE
jgi:hypothetical protein